MNKHDFRRTWEQVTLSPEADARIREALESGCFKSERQVIYMNTDKRRFGKKVSKTAIAALAVALLLSASAVVAAVSRVRMNVQEYTRGGNFLDVGDTPTTDGDIIASSEPYYVKISFDATGSDYLELGSWYPKYIPDGYEETFVSDPATFNGRNQSIQFKNADGQVLGIEIQTAGPGLEMVLANVISEQRVSINGLAGMLYTTVDDHRLLAWSDEERGLGFTIGTDDISIDIVAVANSVRQINYVPTPTDAYKTDDALAELGDYIPAALPEGFSEKSTVGYPREDGGGWYAYVNRCYENDVHDVIYFAYETFSLDPEFEQSAQTVIDFAGGGSSVTVNDLPGAISTVNDETQIVWVDMEKSLEFKLVSGAVSEQELLTMANSITLK